MRRTPSKKNSFKRRRRRAKLHSRAKLQGGALSGQTVKFASRAVSADKKGNVSKAIALYSITVSAIMGELTAYKEGRRARGSFKNAKERDEAMTVASIYISRAEDLKRLQRVMNLPVAPTFNTYTSPTRYKLPIAPRRGREGRKSNCAGLSWSKKWCEERDCRWNASSKKCYSPARA